jgi:hypothetical protein
LHETQRYFFVGLGFAFSPTVGFASAFAGAVASGEAVVAGAVVGEGEGDGEGTASCSGVVDCNTERCPVRLGIESSKAINIKAAAAPIVIFDKRLAVPRGPNAVLEILLENNAPASALPGCNKMTTTSTKQERMNSAYRR